MPSPNPLRFQPLLRRYVWGGRRLGDALGKPLGDADDYAESWEVVDHGEDQSIVLSGYWQGRSLGDLVRNEGDALLGSDAPQAHFPLLFKFLDCHRDLSVQVHPNDAQAARNEPPDLGKTEAWYIVAADPGSKLYAGLRDDVDRKTLEEAAAAGTVAECLHCFEPRAGDCVYIPAGVVHALGAGLLVAEIQQSSDTTFRLFDWNRPGSDGKPRPLHLEQALAVIDFDAGPVAPQIPEAEAGEPLELLIACDKFVMQRLRLECDSYDVGGDNRCRIVAVVEGEVDLEGDLTGQPLRVGQSALLPAASGRLALNASQSATVLIMRLP